MKSIKRRGFIKKSAAASAGMIAAPAYIRGYMQNKPSDTVNVAVAGIRSRGGYYYGGTGHTANYAKIKNSRIVAVCDVDENLFPVEIGWIEKLGGYRPKGVVDFREILDNKDIDAVSIATPDHWHGLQTVWACQAGKDVYIEKPLAWSISEGRKMVQAARKYNRIVQTGTNYRSNRMTQRALELLHEGVIGDIYLGRATVYGHRPDIGRKPDGPVPKGVNWELHRGPAPMIPFNENHFHYNWHWWWDTATGEFGNNGVHGIDRIRVGMGINEHPKKISCCGGVYAWNNGQEVPNLQTATFEYANGKIIEMEVRSLYTPGEQDGILWLGTKGYAELGSDTFKTFMGPKKEPGLNLTVKDLPADGLREELEKSKIEYHFVNFLDCVRSRKRENLNAEVEGGYMSTAIMLLGNIAYKTGRKLIFDGNTETFPNDKEANSYLARQIERKPYVMPKEV
jgi:predicted dehydrogenase